MVAPKPTIPSSATSFGPNEVAEEGMRREGKMIWCILVECVDQSCPWVGLVGYGSRIVVFSGLGRIVGLKW